MRQILRIVFFLIVLIVTPSMWLFGYSQVGAKEASEVCKDLLSSIWHGEN